MSELRRYKSPVQDSARWDGFEFRPDDIIISTPAKSGTTWTQMMCALLVFQTPELPRPLDELSPWLDMLTRKQADVFAELDAQTHRRFIKTHTPLDGMPYDERVTYICVGRDPRDVGLSWDNHVENTDIIALFTARAEAVGLDDIADLLAEGPPPRAETQAERFWVWVDDEQPIEEWFSLANTLHHLQTFWDVRDRSNIVLLHYDDLQADLEGQMRALAARLDIEVAENLWPDLVKAAGFQHMKANAERVAPDVTHKIWIDTGRFFNAGTSGQWQRILTTDADVDRYFTRANALASPDVIAWAHSGSN